MRILDRCKGGTEHKMRILDRCKKEEQSSVPPFTPVPYPHPISSCCRVLPLIPVQYPNFSYKMRMLDGVKGGTEQCSSFYTCSLSSSNILMLSCSSFDTCPIS